jgi:4-amino-4-deoxy-L-arabinose transferase-like glycosyltransferase
VTEPWKRRLTVWRSPAGQPRWARPTLLILAAWSGVAYGWQMGSSIEIYYAAAVRSMSMSWHAFFYGAFDPAGTISVDKLPGALWIQALSVRLLGVHTWAIALPQVLEGVLTVLVLYRVVRRLAGAEAAIVAAAVLAVSPAAVTLDRGNISDTLLILLLVLAADALVGAVVTGSRRGVLLAGLWVGLAFQAKMVEAWLVIPALAITYLVAFGGTRRTRLLRLGAMVAVIAAVSLSWMIFFSVTPASHRPYVDGSQHDSVFEQVFDYNGLGRVGQPSPNTELGRTLGIPVLSAPGPSPAWDRLLRGPYGRDVGWLLPVALAMVPLGLVARRRRLRTDLVRAGVLLWGSWLVVLTAVFSVSTTVNSYYLAVLAPPIAALAGIGGSLAWQRRRSALTQIAVVSVVLLTAGYGYWLLPPSGTGLPEWLAPVLLGLGLLVVGALAATMLLHRDLTGSAVGAAVAGVVLAATLLVPLVASVSVVANRLGPFDTPFQPAAVTSFTRSFFGAPLKPLSTLPKIEAVRNGAPDLMATQTSVLAAPLIFATGQEVLPIGGYTGTIPEPTVAALRSMVAAGRFHLALSAVHSHDPRITWIAHHCLKAPTPPNPASDVIGPLETFYCVPRP